MKVHELQNLIEHLPNHMEVVLEDPRHGIDNDPLESWGIIRENKLYIFKGYRRLTNKQMADWIEEEIKEFKP
jgi:hypothetical protein